MKNLMIQRSLLALVLALLLCLSVLSPGVEAESADSAAAARAPLIRDDADLLTDEEEAALELDMQPLCKYGTPMFWTTTESGDSETLADSFYHQQLALKESGALFVINMRARQLTVFTDGAMHRVIPRSEAETITDNVYRMAGKGDYYGCASGAFAQMLSLMQGDTIARPMKTVSNALLAGVLALMVVYLYVSRRYESKAARGKAEAALPVTAAAAAAFAAKNINRKTRMTRQKKTKLDSGSHGHGGGGGFSGGGGGSSGGGGSHGF